MGVTHRDIHGRKGWRAEDAAEGVQQDLHMVIQREEQSPEDTGSVEREEVLSRRAEGIRPEKGSRYSLSAEHHQGRQGHRFL